MSLKKFEHGQPYGARGPRISLTQNAVLGLNKEAYKLLGSPDRVILLYDEDTAAVGLQRAEKDTPYSYSVVQQAKCASYVVCAKAFCDYHRINHDIVSHFVPESKGDLLVFHLDE